MQPLFDTRLLYSLNGWSQEAQIWFGHNLREFSTHWGDFWFIALKMRYFLKMSLKYLSYRLKYQKSSRRVLNYSPTEPLLQVYLIFGLGCRGVSLWWSGCTLSKRSYLVPTGSWSPKIIYFRRVLKLPFAASSGLVKQEWVWSASTLSILIYFVISNLLEKISEWCLT